MTHVSGPDFLGLQVRDLDRAAAFYQRELGLERASGSPPGVVAFQTSPIRAHVRLPGPDGYAIAIHGAIPEPPPGAPAAKG
jgi:catechol 2,3-dioxygenase-like lactoylglutathione lyase family enzyme